MYPMIISTPTYPVLTPSHHHFNFADEFLPLHILFAHPGLQIQQINAIYEGSKKFF